MKKFISVILTMTMLLTMCVSVSAATATTAEPYDIVKWDGTIVPGTDGASVAGPVTSGNMFPTGGITTTKYQISVLSGGAGTGLSTVERSSGDNCYSIDYSRDLRYDPSTNFNFYAQVTNAKLNKPVFSVMYDIMIPDDANANAERTFTPSFTTANGKSGALGSTEYGEFVVKYANGEFTVDSLVGIDTETVEYATASYTPGSWVTVEVRAYYDATTTKLTYGVYVDDTQILYGVGTTLYPSAIYLDRALWHQPSVLTYFDNICMRTLSVDDKPFKITAEDPNPEPDPDPEPDPEPEPEPDPEPPVIPEVPYENGELLFDYDLNKAFAETELGKRVIIDKFDSVEKYNTEISYEDDGIKISHKGEPIFTNDAKTAGANVDAFGINLTELMSDENGNSVYKTGYNGVYALEYTVNVVQGDWSTNKSTGRADLFIDDSTGTFEGKNNIEIRMPFKPTPKNQVVYWNDSQSLFSLASFESGKDMTVCFVIDTKNKTVEGYTKLANGNYEKAGTGTHALAAITGLWYRIRSYCQDGDSITFKNIKLYEIEKNAEYIGNVAYEKFVADLPAGIVSDAENVVENIVIPEAVTKAGTVATLNEDLVKVDGTVTRRFKDTKTALTVSGNSNGIYYEKVYGFTVKAMDGAEDTKLADYDFASDNIEFVNTVNGTASADGYKLINNKQQGEALGMLKVLGTQDTYTNTYYYDHVGAYDFEISLTPEITDGTAVVEVGNYTESNGFVPFGTVEIAADKIVYCGEDDDVVAVKENTSGNSYNIKFRTYTDEKGMWISVNSKEISQLPYSYITTKNVLNAYRVVFTGATEKDSIVIEDASLTRLLKSENADLKQTLDAADSIGIYNVTQNPDNAYGNITLPTILGYDVKWAANNPLADLEQGKVFCTEDDTDIVVSAVISPKNKPDTKVLKEFKITVLGTDDPEYLLEGALAKIIPEKITNQNPDAIIADLEFPETTVEGYDITWDSLNDGIISDRGVINKNVNIPADTKVTFKATVIAPSGSASKDITFTIAKRGADVACNMADISESAEGLVTYSAKVSNTNGSMYLHDGNDNKIIGFSVANSKLTFDNGAEYPVNGDSFTIKAVMNSADRKVSVFVNGKLVLDYVAYTEKANGFKTVAKNGLTISEEKAIFDEYSLFDYNVKLFDYFDNLGEGHINSNVVLKTNSVGGVNVEWTSSDNGILSNNGAYTVQDSISFFNVRAKLTVNGGTAAYYEKVVECVAVPGEDKNVISGATVITDIKEDINNDKTKGFDNNFSTYFVGTKINENSYITIDMGGLNDINSIYFFRDADDTNLKSCDIYVSENGTEWNGPVASVNFTDLRSNHVKFNMQTARYIKIANIVTENGSIKLYEIKGYISYSSDDKAYKDIMALDMPEEYVLNASSITLPKVGSVYGSTLVWTSSDNSVISTDGKIVKPSGKKEKEVVLTVKATFEGKTSVKSFKYLVKGDGKASGGAGGAGGGGGGNIAGVNTGGTTITALPKENDIIQTPSQENIKTEFKDVKTSDWFYTYLMKLKSKEIIDGYEDGNFYPNNKITREEFVKMLVNVAGFELVEEYEGFEDVSEDDWFAPYVYTAKKLNIVNGIDQSNFGVGSPISRQDMSVMIYNVITMKKEVSASKDKFVDDSTIADYASNAVYSMKALGILDGYEDGTFKPQGNLTRAEASKVISMIMDMQ